MTIRTRLKRLESVDQHRRTVVAETISDPTPEEWLARFEEYGRTGLFDQEPDFPIALAAYRHSLTRAKVPTDLEPSKDRSWKTNYEVEIHAALMWLAEFYIRSRNETPPVTTTEFGELAEWFERNFDRLKKACDGELFEFTQANGKSKMGIDYFRMQVKNGPKVRHAGEVAEHIRRLRARFNERLTSGSETGLKEESSAAIK